MFLTNAMLKATVPSIMKTTSTPVFAMSRYRRNYNDIRSSKCLTTTWMQQHSNNLHRSQHHLAQGDGKEGKGPAAKQSPGSLKKKESFLNFISSRMLKFLDRYQNLLEAKFPGAMKIYRVFVIGFKDFTVETKDYLNIQRRVLMTPTKVTDLSRRDIDIYYRMPGEMMRVGPTLLISALPFANYVVFPLAYYFPKKLLSSHFWSLQQKSQFAVEFHKQKLLNYRPLFRHLQLNVDQIINKDLIGKFQDSLHQLGCGAHPTANDILEFRLLFEKDRYSLKAIHGPHVKTLCRLHSCQRLYLNRRKLYDQAEMFRSLDSVLARDSVEDLNTEELRNACFLRGLNASNLDNNELRKYLHSWLAVSQELNSRANSLLLHLPIFLSYNHPNNWALLKS